MSRKKLLNLDQKKELYNCYHNYLRDCKEKEEKPVIREFIIEMISNNPTFSKFEPKKLENSLEQNRLSDGAVLWPRIKDLKKDISSYNPPSLEKHFKEQFIEKLKKSIDSYDLFSSSNNDLIKQMIPVLATDILRIPFSDDTLDLVGREKVIVKYLVDYYPDFIRDLAKLSPDKIYFLINYLAQNNYDQFSNLIEEILKSNITEFDIQAIAYRKQQLDEFDKLLRDDEYFDLILKNDKTSTEKIWQNFFEKNKWIFGYGLNYVFTTSLNNKKLEQIVAGSDFYSSGKRVDGLLKTKGKISSLCFVEIKTHKDSLLKDIRKPYRTDCWQISEILSGAVAQIQKTVNKVKEFQTKYEITSKTGDPTGEVIFSVEPKSFIIIGNLEEFITNNGVNQEKYKSFEIFRKNLINPEIITYDELFERASYIVQQQSQ